MTDPSAPTGRAVLPGLIVAAAAFAWLPGINSPFLFDDWNTITQNPAIRSLDLVGFFTDPTLASVKPGNWPWRPLLLVFDSLRHALFGLDPLGWHLSQLALHALNSVLVWLVARRVFRLGPAAVLAGLWFALAPVQAQSALYLSARSMVVAAPLALGALLAATGDGRRRWLTSAALTFAAMMASEGALVTAGWIGLAYWTRGEDLRSRPRAATLAATLAAGGLYYLLRSLLPAPTGLELLDYWRDSFDWQRHVLTQLGAPFALGRYFLLPTGSSFFHDAPAVGLTSPRTLATAAALLAAAALVLAAQRRPWARAGAAGLAWYLGSLLPAAFTPLNLALAEHRAYLALPGLCLVSAWLLDRLLVAGGDRPLRRAALVAAGLIVASHGLAAASRAEGWRSADAVFRQSVRRSPTYFAGWSMLGVDAYQRGDCERALAYLGRAVALSPGFADGYNTMAACQVRSGDWRAAVESGERATRLDPLNPSYHNTVAAALMAGGRYREARPWLERALSLASPTDPNRPVMARNLEKLNRSLNSPPP